MLRFVVLRLLCRDCLTEIVYVDFCCAKYVVLSLSCGGCCVEVAVVRLLCWGCSAEFAMLRLLC